MEQIVVEAHIWARSPDEAQEKAEKRSLDDLIGPCGYFVEVVPDSFDIIDEIVGAKKVDYKSGGNNWIPLHYD